MPSLRTAWFLVPAALFTVAVVGSSAEGQKRDETISVITEQAPDQWRASKLIGIGIFDLQGEKIGSISEVLIDRNGVAKIAVIDVGGFFGIGKKSVGVPFGALKFVSHEDVAPKTYNAPANKSPLVPLPKILNTKPVTDASSGYPDHAIITLTDAQLKSAPDFRYARATVLTTNTPTGSIGPLNAPGGPAPQ
jgi:sporulation protein YlmC with PRC-barrel domain